MTSSDRTIEDTAEICLEILDGKALCRECTIDPQGSAPELDFRAFCSTDPAEFSAHILKHIALRQNVDIRLADVALWEEALRVHPRGAGLVPHSVSA